MDGVAEEAPGVSLVEVDGVEPRRGEAHGEERLLEVDGVRRVVVSRESHVLRHV